MADAAVEWAPASARLVELDYVDDVGAERRLRLSACVDIRFEAHAAGTHLLLVTWSLDYPTPDIARYM